MKKVFRIYKEVRLEVHTDSNAYYAQHGDSTNTDITIDELVTFYNGYGCDYVFNFDSEDAAIAKLDEIKKGADDVYIIKTALIQ